MRLARLISVLTMLAAAFCARAQYDIDQFFIRGQMALNEGYIIPLYPDQPHHPRQKYCLTDKGKALLNG